MAEVELGPGITMATVRLYINKVSPFNNEAYNKNVFLDRLIEEFYLSLEKKKLKKHDDIEKMKKHIEHLEEVKELAEQFGEDGVEENLMEDEDGGAKFKLRSKAKINPYMLGKKIQNLKSVVSSQSRMLHANQTTTAFVPPNKFIDVDSKYISFLITVSVF